MKELNIEVPEGYEIDNENSDLSKGIIRFKLKKITYSDICKKLNFHKNQYFIDAGSIPLIRDFDTEFTINEFVGNEASTKEQLESLLALNKLKNVANYLNGDWRPDWNISTAKYILRLYKDRLIIDATYESNSGAIVFETSDMAREAFKILGEDTIELALNFGSL